MTATRPIEIGKSKGARVSESGNLRKHFERSTSVYEVRKGERLSSNRAKKQQPRYHSGKRNGGFAFRYQRRKQQERRGLFHYRKVVGLVQRRISYMQVSRAVLRRIVIKIKEKGDNDK